MLPSGPKSIHAPTPIPIDPFYLTWKAKEVGLNTRFIELAGAINAWMPNFVISRVATALNDEGKALRGARILICGIAYKADVADVRETPAAEIIKRLLAEGAEVSYHDPHVPVFPPMRRYDIELTSEPLSEHFLRSQDCVLIVTDHRAIDWESVGKLAGLVVDTRNVFSDPSSVDARV